MEQPEEQVRRLLSALSALGVEELALTGAIALGVWVEPRATRDIDLIAALPQSAVDPLLAQYDGMRFGPSELPDLVRFRIGDWDVDLFVAKGATDRECLARAKAVDLGGVEVRVVTPEDLVIHKLRKLRVDRRRILQDVADLRALFDRHPDLDTAYVVARVSPDERMLVESVRDLSDQELLARILGP